MIKYIITELDERSKEEKFKIKKILANKRKHRETEELIKEQHSNNAIKEEETIFANEDDDEDEILFK